jgi:hypothetical protein
MKYNGASGGDQLNNAGIPTVTLTSATNLRCSVQTANNLVDTYVQVIEFNDLNVTSGIITGSANLTEDVVVSAPTYGGAILRGCFGRFGTANDTTDDSGRNTWTASLSGGTWTFTRQDNASNADLSYEIFDYNDLYGGGGGSITAPTVQPIHAIGTNGNSFATFTGTYSGITPTLVEARVMQGVSEVIAWSSVSFGGGSYSYTPSIPAGAGYTIEVRTTVDATLYSDTSASFDVGPVLGIIGSSSAVRCFTEGSQTLTGRSHVKKSGTWTLYDSTLETGSPWVELANYLEAKFNAPTGFYDYGVNGTRLLVEWLPPSGTSYTAFTGAVVDNNISAIVDVAGSNDTRNGATLTLANFTNFYSNLRSDVRNCPIIRLTNQRFPGVAVDSQALAAWTASQELADLSADNYQVWRIDLDITFDNIHNTTAGYETAYLRVGSCFDSAFGSGTYYKGPSIQSAAITGPTEITLTLDNTDSDYTNISPTTNLAGFRVDGGLISITSANVSGGNIVLSLGSTPIEGDTVEFAAYEADVPGGLVFTNYPTVDSENNMPIDPITTPLLAIGSVSGSLNSVLTGDSLLSTGSVINPVTGTLNVLLQSDSLIASGAVADVVGSLNVTISGDSLAASGNVSAGTITGSLNVTLANTALSASGTASNPNPVKAECTLVTRAGTSRPNLSSLSWAWFDTVDPNIFNAPTDQGFAESTDTQGKIVVELPNSLLSPGQYGTLVLRSSDGSTLGAYNLLVIS